MTKSELRSLLARLSLSQLQAASLLSVNPRTMRRWAENPPEMPGATEMALRAWDRLHSLGLAWRPDGVPIGEDDPEEIAKQIALYREHAIELDAILRRVKARGGPAAPWKVDLEKNEARLGPMRISFYRLVNGGFSPASYSRSDEQPDPVRDAALLEDAYACIAKALAATGRISHSSYRGRVRGTTGLTRA